jgi:hypothetical protein
VLVGKKRMKIMQNVLNIANSLRILKIIAKFHNLISKNIPISKNSFVKIKYPAMDAKWIK